MASAREKRAGPRPADLRDSEEKSRTEDAENEKHARGEDAHEDHVDESREEGVAVGDHDAKERREEPKERGVESGETTAAHTKAEKEVLADNESSAVVDVDMVDAEPVVRGTARPKAGQEDGRDVKTVEIVTDAEKTPAKKEMDRANSEMISSTYHLGRRRSTRARKTRFSARQLAESANDENFVWEGDDDDTNDADYAFAATEMSSDEAFRLALDRSKRETSGQGAGDGPREQRRLIQPPCVRFMRNQTPMQATGLVALGTTTLDSSVASDISAPASLATSGDVTVDLTLDSDDEDDEAVSRPTALLRGELVKTPFGLGSVQNTFHRFEEKIVQVVPSGAVQTVLPSQDDKFLTVASTEAGFQKGDRIICGTWEPSELHEKLAGSSSSSSSSSSNLVGDALQAIRQTPFTMYEVWLQWGDGDPVALPDSSKERPECDSDSDDAVVDTIDSSVVSKSSKKTRSRKSRAIDKTDFSVVWMPKAFMRDDQLQRASTCPAVKYTMPVPFGAYKPRNCTIELTSDDMARVWPGLHLNDAILDYWIGHILAGVERSRLEKLYVFHSLFFNWLEQQVSSLGPSQGYAWVANATKNTDIFAKDILVIPINAHLHWTLAIVCNPGLLGEAVAERPKAQTLSASDDAPSAHQEPAPKKARLDSAPAALGAEAEASIEAGADSQSEPGAREPRNQDAADPDGSVRVPASKPSPASSPASPPGCRSPIADAPEPSSPKREEMEKQPDSEDAASEGAAARKNRRKNNRAKRKRPPASSSSKKHARRPEPAAKRRPYVIFLDSLRGNQTQRVLKLLRQYLEQEWLARKGPLKGPVNADALPGFSPIVPTQMNQCDCGVYLLEYTERILTEKLDDLFRLVSDDTLAPRKVRSAVNSLFGKHWFGARDVAKTRAKILRALKRDTGNQPPESARLSRAAQGCYFF